MPLEVLAKRGDGLAPVATLEATKSEVRHERQEILLGREKTLVEAQPYLMGLPRVGLGGKNAAAVVGEDDPGQAFADEGAKRFFQSLGLSCLRFRIEAVSVVTIRFVRGCIGKVQGLEVEAALERRGGRVGALHGERLARRQEDLSRASGILRSPLNSLNMFEESGVAPVLDLVCVLSSCRFGLV